MAAKVRVCELLLQAGGPFPWYGTYRGEPIVTITVAELRRLQQGKHRSAEPSKGRRNAYAPKMRLTRWEQDAEVSAFVRDRLGKAAQTLIRQEVAIRFGQARTPSKTSLSRFAVRCGLDQSGTVVGDAGYGLDGTATSTALKAR